MIKRDLAEHGLLLLIPQEAAYGEELKKLKLDSQPGMDVAKPGSVILKNTSQHSLSAFGIRWKIADPKGFLWTRDVMHMEPRALLDGGRARMEQILIPGVASRLITVEGLIRNPEALKDFSSAFLEPGFSPASVQLDFAVFDDGEVVGPDEIGMLPAFQATINAKQDLMEEISAKLGLKYTWRINSPRGIIGYALGPTVPKILQSSLPHGQGWKDKPPCLSLHSHSCNLRHNIRGSIGFWIIRKFRESSHVLPLQSHFLGGQQ